MPSAALVTCGGGTGLELLLPNLADDEPVPDMMIFLSACMIRAEDEPEFFDQMLEWFGGRLKVQ